MIPCRPAVFTWNTVSNGSHDEIPVRVRVPPLWVNETAAPVRKLVTEETLYPLSRNRSVLVLGLVTTWMNCRLGLVLLIVVTPWLPSFQKPGFRPPNMYPPPSVPLMEPKIWFR